MTESLYMSYSRWSSTLRCGEEAKLSRLGTLPERPAPWTIIGSALHSAYEEWEGHQRTTQIADLFEAEYDALIESGKGMQPDLSLWIGRPRSKTIQTDIDYYRKEGIRQAVTYQARVLSEGWEPVAVELPFDIHIGHLEDSTGRQYREVRFRGSIDLLVGWPDGRVTIRDLKAGTKEKDNRQLSAYLLALQEDGRYSGVEWGEYFMSKRDVSAGWVHISSMSWDSFRSTVMKVAEMWERDLLLPNPSPDTCFGCAVQPACSYYNPQ